MYLHCAATPDSALLVHTKSMHKTHRLQASEQPLSVKKGTDHTLPTEYTLKRFDIMVSGGLADCTLEVR